MTTFTRGTFFADNVENFTSKKQINKFFQSVILHQFSRMKSWIWFKFLSRETEIRFELEQPSEHSSAHVL